jgi:hypothetical protein
MVLPLLKQLGIGGRLGRPREFQFVYQLAEARGYLKQSLLFAVGLKLML